VRGVLRVAAAVVEEITDVVRAKDLDQTLVFGAVLVEALELVATGAERPGRRMAQGRDRLIGLLRRIDQVLVQRAQDAVAPGEHRGEFAAAPGGLDDPARGRIDHGSHPAGLGVKDVVATHRCTLFRGRRPRDPAPSMVEIVPQRRRAVTAACAR
jgi:hypothetical protein